MRNHGIYSVKIRLTDHLFFFLHSIALKYLIKSIKRLDRPRKETCQLDKLISSHTIAIALSILSLSPCHLDDTLEHHYQERMFGRYCLDGMKCKTGGLILILMS